MAGGRVFDSAGYAGVALTLAQQALSIATDSAPHRARAGERRWSMVQALPAARVLIDRAEQADRDALPHAAEALCLTLAEDKGKITDGFGHHRSIYGLFAVHLLGTAARVIGCDATLDHTRQAAEAALNTSPTKPQDTDARLAVWRRLIARQHGMNEAEDMPLASDTPAPLSPLGLDDLIDSWTYHELVGLHGMHLCAVLEGDEQLAERVHFAAMYHLGHTQPDYTTYQPWGLAAFASDAQTAVFAEQQLHDVATHLSIEGPGSAVMPALLLADSTAAMSGTVAKAWGTA